MPEKVPERTFGEISKETPEEFSRNPLMEFQIAGGFSEGTVK